MEARPKLKIELTAGDKILEAVGFFVLILFWVGTIAFFPILPDQIPSHFDAAGQADDFSDKKNIFVLLIVETLIYAVMTILNKHPHIYSYPTPVTQENARRLYTSVTKLIRVLKLVVVLIFNVILFMTYKIALGKTEGLGAGFLPLVVGLMVLPCMFYWIKSSGSKQSLKKPR